jgi:hypothetical protein
MKKINTISVMLFTGIVIMIFSLQSKNIPIFSKLKPTILKKINNIQTAPQVTKIISITPLTLEKIFYGDKTYLNNLDKNRLISIISTGDIIPARMVNFQATKFNDFTWSYKNVWQTLNNADLTVVNLEAPLLKNCQPTTDGMTFCASDKNIQGLVKSGIDLVTLANNHARNYGQEGIDETVSLLTANNIKHTGLGQITYLTIKKIKFSFLGWDFLENVPEKLVTSQVSDAKNNSDIVVVFPHWGEEYQEMPSTFESNMNKTLLNSGADIILGNHPHIIQPISISGKSLTFFAHGNFIFDQEWSEETKKGFIAKTYIYNGRIIDEEIIPIHIKDYGQPEIVQGEEKIKMLEDLYKLSKRYIELSN